MVRDYINNLYYYIIMLCGEKGYDGSIIRTRMTHYTQYIYCTLQYFMVYVTY